MGDNLNLDDSPEVIQMIDEGPVLPDHRIM